MLTPQDVQDKVFPRALVGGYDMTAVDDFLETMTEDYSSLFKENAILKGKLKVLVEKVEEYRSTEDSMRMALLTAQKMGDDLLEEANKKKDAMLADADDLYQKRLQETNAALSAEQAKLDAAKAATAEYVRQAGELLRAHTEFLARLDEISVPDERPEPDAAPAAEPDAAPAAAPAATIPAEEPAPAEPATEEDTLREIDAAMARLNFEDPSGEKPLRKDDSPNDEVLVMPEEAAPPQAEAEIGDVLEGLEDLKGLEEAESDLTPRPKFDFDNLQFGVNYNADGEKK